MESEILFKLEFDSKVDNSFKDLLLHKFIDEFVVENSFLAGGSLEGIGIFNYSDKIDDAGLQQLIEEFFRAIEGVDIIKYQVYNNLTDSFEIYKVVRLK